MKKNSEYDNSKHRSVIYQTLLKVQFATIDIAYCNFNSLS